MKMSVLARRDVAWFAAGVIAGAALGKLRRQAERPKVVDEASLPGGKASRRQIEPVRQEPTPAPATAAAEKAPPTDRVQGLTKKQLYHEARKRNIRGRSTMTKAELRRALG